MLSLLSLLALSSVASVATALPSHPFTNIVARADTPSLPGGATIPAACESTCASTLQVYGYCLDASTQCLDICTEDGFNQFYSCVNCAFGLESFNATQYVQIQATASALSQTCSGAGKAVSVSASLTPYAELSSMWNTPGYSTSAAAAATNSLAASAATAVTTGSVASVASVSAAAASSSAAAASSAGATSSGSKSLGLSAGLAGLVVFAGALLA